MTTANHDSAAALRAIAEDLMEAGELAKTDVDEACRLTVAIMGRVLTEPAFSAIRDGDEDDQFGQHLNAIGASALEEDNPDVPAYVSHHLHAAARLLQGIARRIEGEGVADV